MELALLLIFFPKNIEIKAGQSVTWSNPTTVGEPHTVTFVLDNNTMAGVVSPLAILNTTKFISMPLALTMLQYYYLVKTVQIP